MPLPARLSIPPLILSLLLNLNCAAGAELRDAGYGDGSLVDSYGNYYYPQPNGGYMDTYGAAFDAVGDGLYSDAIGNTIDTGPGPSGRQPPAAHGARKPIPRPDALDHDPTPVPPGTDRPGDRTDSAGNSDLGPRYLEDVGDGYLTISPGTLPPERSAGKGPGAADAATEPDFLGPEFAVENPATASDMSGSRTLDDSTLKGEDTGPRRRAGPVERTPQRLRPTD